VADTSTAKNELPAAGLTDEPIDPTTLLASVAMPSDGAVASFVGVVRDNQDGRPVQYLEYEAHEGMAVTHLERLVVEARRRWNIGRALVRHRLGRLEIGEVSVAIAVAAPHRDEAITACRWLIDTLKTDVPIFKKEHYEDGDAWVE
jgi:molybdopterin synthase catalytic subunit